QLRNYRSDWNFANIRPGAFMFWWLFYTTNTQANSPYDKPLVIWIQGGPGDSGTGFGNFAEIGPLDMNLNPRQSSWVKECNILFVDSPVGSGFSYTDSDSLLAANNSQIAEDLLLFMKIFLELKPEFREVPTYIFAESYGAKMAAEFALKWHRNLSSIKSNLKGLTLGSSFLSPVDTIAGFAPYLMEQGIVDQDTSEVIAQKLEDLTNKIVEKHWSDAFHSQRQVMEFVSRKIGSPDFYNIKWDNKNHLHKNAPISFSTTLDEMFQNLTILMNEKINNSLGIRTNKKWGAQSDSVVEALADDFFKPAVSVVESLLNETNLKILTYTGELDLVTNKVGAHKWSERLSWRYAENWRSSPEIPLIVNNNTEAFYKSYDRFSYFRVLRAGHFTPIDNPTAMLEVLKYMIGS
ncbi:hypothetical protein QAD02_009683, partial [Eretmocerus hayati]